MSEEKLELLAQVASWYYEGRLDQEDIGRRIGRSRSMVSRLLQEAHDQGLIEIRVNHPLKTDLDLEARLCTTFGLAQAQVLANAPADDAMLLRRLGLLGARCVQNFLHDGIQIGVGWGTAVHEVVRALPVRPLRDARVIQIIGAIGRGDPMIDGAELGRWLAQKLSASFRSLHAPLIVDDVRLAEGLLQERTIAESLALAQRAEVALVGVGTVRPGQSSLLRSGYLTEADLQLLQQAGAVGDIVARQLDAAGQPLDLELNRRVIGVGLDTVRGLPMVVGVAGGMAKAEAILAVLRGHYLKALVTDAPTAARVLALHAGSR